MLWLVPSSDSRPTQGQLLCDVTHYTTTVVYNFFNRPYTRLTTENRIVLRCTLYNKLSWLVLSWPYIWLETDCCVVCAWLKLSKFQISSCAKYSLPMPSSTASIGPILGHVHACISAPIYLCIQIKIHKNYFSRSCRNVLSPKTLGSSRISCLRSQRRRQNSTWNGASTLGFGSLAPQTMWKAPNSPKNRALQKCQKNKRSFIRTDLEINIYISDIMGHFIMDLLVPNRLCTAVFRIVKQPKGHVQCQEPCITT